MRSTEEIYAAMTARLTELSGAAVTEGGDLSLRLHAVAAEIFSLEAQAEFNARQCFPQTAVGAYLDNHAAMRGLSRNPAECAEGLLRFSVSSPAAAALDIPEGTECHTAAGTAFRTTAAGMIGPGETACSVPAEAVLSGSGGNVPAGSVCVMVLPPVGVEQVTNPAAFSGGCEAESDAALRERVLASLRRLPNGANAAYYESRVLDFPGVAAVLVLPRNRGTGTVDVVFSTVSGVPTAAEIAAVKAALEAEREICVDLEVTAPETEAVTVSAELEVAECRDYDEVSAAAEAAVRAYFSGALLNKPVYRARLEALLMAVDGVENCIITAPETDIAAAEGTLLVLSAVSFSEAE